MKYKKILRKIDVSKMQNIIVEKDITINTYNIFYWNLWSQFGFTPQKVEKLHQKGIFPKVSDYAWTQEVANEFYNHPYNKKFFQLLRKKCNSEWYNWWILNAEPVVVE